ncbi:MAG: hypothetical protein KY466_08390 [Gemmatimonadetes bacterium]|nr:hypothetical protein [Gemmatimonadota bacterium]
MEFRTGNFVGVVAMALVWGFLWALPGGAIEAIDNVAPGAHGFTRQIDMWPQTLGLPGLVGGVLFSVLLLITQGRRGFAELSLRRSGAWGAVAGMLVGALVVWVVASGLSEPWQLAALLGVATLLGAAAGVGSTLLFRYVARRRAAATA